MRDVEMMRRIVACLADPELGAAARLDNAFPVQILRNYQPSQQGRVDGAAIYFFKVGERRLGQRKIAERFNPDTLLMDRTERQQMSTTWQFGALVPEYPEQDENIPTAADLIKAAASCLQTPEFIRGLKAVGAGMLAVTDVVNTPIENDRGQFENEPHFDATITHQDEALFVVPGTSTVDVKIKRV